MNVLSSAEIDVEDEMVPKHVTETPAFSHELGLSKQRSQAAKHQQIPVTAVPAVLAHDQTSSTMDAAVQCQQNFAEALDTPTDRTHEEFRSLTHEFSQ